MKRRTEDVLARIDDALAEQTLAVIARVEAWLDETRDERFKAADDNENYSTDMEMFELVDDHYQYCRCHLDGHIHPLKSMVWEANGAETADDPFTARTLAGAS